MTRLRYYSVGLLALLIFGLIAWATDGLYDVLREANSWVGILAFGCVTYRVVSQWNSTHFIPQWFYRVSSLLLAYLCLVVALGSVQYRASHSPAGPVSVAAAAGLAAVLALCWYWPRDKKETHP